MDEKQIEYRNRYSKQNMIYYSVFLFGLINFIILWRLGYFDDEPGGIAFIIIYAAFTIFYIHDYYFSKYKEKKFVLLNHEKKSHIHYCLFFDIEKRLVNYYPIIGELKFSLSDDKVYNVILKCNGKKEEIVDIEEDNFNEIEYKLSDIYNGLLDLETRDILQKEKENKRNKKNSIFNSIVRKVKAILFLVIGALFVILGISKLFKFSGVVLLAWGVIFLVFAIAEFLNN